jgi:hypothetical protein
MLPDILDHVPRATARGFGGSAIHRGWPTAAVRLGPSGADRSMTPVQKAYDQAMGSESGRNVFEPRTGRERIDALRSVLSSREPARIDGVFVEYHWARMILELFEELGPEAQGRLAETAVFRMRDLIDAWATGRGSRADADPGREGR